MGAGCMYARPSGREVHGVRARAGLVRDDGTYVCFAASNTEPAVES
jgi:hypothetical protein